MGRHTTDGEAIRKDKKVRNGRGKKQHTYVKGGERNTRHIREGRERWGDWGNVGGVSNGKRNGRQRKGASKRTRSCGADRT